MIGHARRTHAAVRVVVSAALGVWPAASGAAAGFSVLHNFAGGTDGSGPGAALIADPSGNLYGTTVRGGTTSGCGGLGCGTVFALSPPGAQGGTWSEAVLYRFTGNQDGGSPGAGLLRDGNGNLYGTAEAGGSMGGGVVFELSPPGAGQTDWTQTVLHAFASSAGSPVAGLIFGPAGVLYGATETGGTGGSAGTVFALTPPAAGKTKWAARTIFSFDGRDGSGPIANLVADSAGNLYGTTFSGGAKSASGYGVVYELVPPAGGAGRWHEQVLLHFKGEAGGRDPLCALAMDGSGNLYGTTTSGGLKKGQGTVFELIRPAAGSVWTEAVLFQFPNNGAFGRRPYAGVIFDGGGNLYGTTSFGGPGDGYGVVFQLAPAGGGTSWTETVLHHFSDGADGGIVEAGLLLGADGTLYGTTDSGGSAGRGVAFSVAP
jgi:uncharacterized repeat protein (TIGR03803 family)